MKIPGFIAICMTAYPLQCQSWSSTFTPCNGHPSHCRCHNTPKCNLSMKVKVGLVGLPNVGKSSLFNAIAQKSIADAKNFPFCTIDPNTTPIPIPDANLSRLAALAKSKKALPATISLIDVAGLVRGASRGEGLGNRFLATVRECDLIVHVVRDYVDEDIIHVDGRVDPVADAEVVNLELLLADLAHIQRRLEKKTCKGEERDVLSKLEAALENGRPARTLGLSSAEKFAIKSMGLLTLKPVIYAFNIDEVDFALDKDGSMKVAEGYMKQIQYCDLERDSYLVVSAKLESELVALSTEERNSYLGDKGAICTSNVSDEYSELLSYHDLPLLVMNVLDLALVYTGPGVPQERSQTTKTHIVASKTKTVLDLAGKLHGDIQKGFISADVVDAQELIDCDTYNAAKEDGKIRMEGRDYILRDGDVALIKWK